MSRLKGHWEEQEAWLGSPGQQMEVPEASQLQGVGFPLGSVGFKPLTGLPSLEHQNRERHPHKNLVV